MEIQEGFNNPKPGVLFHQSRKELSATSKNLRSRTFRSHVSKGESKKTLVRNTELPVHPTIYKSDVPVEDTKDKDKMSNAQPPLTGLYRTNLSAPCLNSALRLVKEMKQASKARPSKAQYSKLVDEGKVLQQVNFLYEERLYHDLVALNVSDSNVIEENSSRPTSKFRAREKDKEPQLSQFFTPSFSEEYHIPRDLPQRPHRSTNVDNKSFSVYQRMKLWNGND